MSEQKAQWFRDTFNSVRTEVRKAIVGQEDIVEGVLIGLAANGNVLLEGMPGLGKTLLVRSLSQALHLSFNRIQFTPDLMPADVTGTNILADTGAGSKGFEFRRGPIFANLILADEINRATPKTQSAMLEAMQERSVTVGGVRHVLEEPFLVMATQNPIEQEGTYPLPEAQLDRFLMKLLVPFPSRSELADIVTRTTGKDPSDLEPVAEKDAVLEMRKILREVPVAEPVLQYALSIVLATHPDSEGASDVAKRYIRFGSSPRGAQSIVTIGKAYALLAGRYNLAKEDLNKAVKPALRHRILLNFEAEADGMSPDRILSDVVEHAERADRDPIRV
ncbi:MAG TPA: AAA family ATPase [Fimbriimonadaceae bacterium]|jgi:MoxR-like ATPase